MPSGETKLLYLTSSVLGRFAGYGQLSHSGPLKISLNGHNLKSLPNLQRVWRPGRAPVKGVCKSTVDLTPSLAPVVVWLCPAYLRSSGSIAGREIGRENK